MVQIRWFLVLMMGVFVFGSVASEVRDPFSLPKNTEEGPFLTQLIEIHHREAEEIVELIRMQQDLISLKGSLLADKSLNAIVIRDTKEVVASVKALIKILDIKRGQIGIEARLVVVSQDASQEVGARLGLSSRNGFFQAAFNAEEAQRVQLREGAGSQHSKMNADLLRPGVLLDVELTLLEKEGLCEVVSSPRVITANREEAIIESGEEIPFKTTTTTQGVTQFGVEFKKAVLALRVTPSITPGGDIDLLLDVHQDTRGQETSEGPAIDTQKIKTQIQVANGETVVLGGVFKRTEVNQISKTPILGDIPFLKYFFRKTKKINKKQELLVFITPKIIK